MHHSNWPRKGLLAVWQLRQTPCLPTLPPSFPVTPNPRCFFPISSLQCPIQSDAASMLCYQQVLLDCEVVTARFCGAWRRPRVIFSFPIQKQMPKQWFSTESIYQICRVTFTGSMRLGKRLVSRSLNFIIGKGVVQMSFDKCFWAGQKPVRVPRF